MKNGFIDRLRERFLKEFLDVLIIKRIRDKEYGGYDLLSYFHEYFNIMISPGTLYSTLYSLEREGYIEAHDEGRKRVYSLTSEGEGVLKEIDESKDTLGDFFSQILQRKFGKTEDESKHAFLPKIDLQVDTLQK